MYEKEFNVAEPEGERWNIALELLEEGKTILFKEQLRDTERAISQLRAKDDGFRSIVASRSN